MGQSFGLVPDDSFQALLIEAENRSGRFFCFTTEEQPESLTTEDYNMEVEEGDFGKELPF